MRRVFLLTFFVSLISLAQNKKTDFELENLKGNVKSIRTIPYVATSIGNSVEKGEIYRGDAPIYKNTLVTYDKGMQTDYRAYSPNGDLKEHYQYNFDHRGNKIERIEYDIYENPFYIRTFTLDDKDRVIQTNICVASGDFCIINIYYDYTEPKTKKITVETDEGDIKESYKIVYDDKGNTISEEKFDNTGKRIEYFTCSYDNKNNLVEKKSKQTCSYKYNDHNDCIEEKTSKSEKLQKKTFEYTYDKHNNWISKVEYIDGKASVITEREISYY